VPPTLVAFVFVVLAALGAAGLIHAAGPAPAAQQAVDRSLPPAQELIARYGPALVEVEGPGGKSPGFVVSSRGVACTVFARARVGQVVTIVRRLSVDDPGALRRVPGLVVAAEPSGLALVAVDEPDAADPWVALGVVPAPRVPQPEEWLLALVVGKAGDATVVVGSLQHVRDDGRLALMLPATAGAPVLDRRGQVVAVVVQGLGGGQSRAVSAARIGTLAAQVVDAPLKDVSDKVHPEP
jgi:hypothetical protein